MRPDRWTLSAFALLAGLGVAAAQAPTPAQPQAPAAQNQANTAAQQDDKAKPAQAGAEEPGSHPPAASAPPTAVFVDGKLAVPGAPADSQTVPSKVSERNAWLDSQPMMALPLGITDEQKRHIADSLKDTPTTDKISAKPADILPATTETTEFSKEIKDAIPMVSDLEFIKTRDKILLVRAPNMVVVGEIATN